MTDHSIRRQQLLVSEFFPDGRPARQLSFWWQIDDVPDGMLMLELAEPGEHGFQERVFFDRGSFEQFAQTVDEVRALYPKPDAD